MASILPNQVLPEGIPFIDRHGKNDHNWWLFFYNLSQNVLGNAGTSTSALAAQINAEVDLDAAYVDLLPLNQRVANLEKQLADPYPESPNSAALMLAYDDLLPDPAQIAPVQVLTPGSSPWTYQALQNGSVVISGGSVSAVTLSRDGATFYAVAVGQVTMKRGDSVKITYSSTPTVVLFPG
jgi:hypothetical protein